MKTEYLKQYPVQTVGGSIYQELWIPAGKLPEFNHHIVGKIEVVSEFYDR